MRKMVFEQSSYDSWKTREPEGDAPVGTFARIEIHRGELSGEACAWFSPAGTPWKVEAFVVDHNGLSVEVEVTGVEMVELDQAQIEDTQTDYSERSESLRDDRGDL